MKKSDVEGIEELLLNGGIPAAAAKTLAETLWKMTAERRSVLGVAILFLDVPAENLVETYTKELAPPAGVEPASPGPQPSALPLS